MFVFVYRKSHLISRLRLQLQLTKQFGQRKPITDTGWEREESARDYLTEAAGGI